MKYSSKAKAAFFIATAGLALGTVPAGAQPRQTQNQNPPPAAQQARELDKPITQDNVGAKDVALTPLSDLNLKKDDIPQLLLDAQDDPYDLAGLRTCPLIANEVTKFDRVLGEDLDISDATVRRMSTGRAAQEALGSFIPFRGVIREISGANSQQRKIQAAIVAGTARRSFLKGVGLQRGCRYPARPATPQVIDQLNAQAEAAARTKDQQRGNNGPQPTGQRPR